MIINSAVITNDDDCVALKPGCRYAAVTSITRTGSYSIAVSKLQSFMFPSRCARGNKGIKGALEREL